MLLRAGTTATTNAALREQSAVTISRGGSPAKPLGYWPATDRGRGGLLEDAEVVDLVGLGEGRAGRVAAVHPTEREVDDHVCLLHERALAVRVQHVRQLGAVH